MRASMMKNWSFFKVEQLAFWLLVGLYALPIWRWHYFLTIDGPTHLYNAWLLKAMLLAPHGMFQQWLAFNINPEPNYLSHLLLGGMLAVLPPWLAEKLLQTAYVVGLPLAMRYLIRSWQPAAGFLATLVFPFIYSVVFIFGFYNFCLSLVLLLLVLGYWRRHVARPTPPVRSVGALAGLVTLLYFSHPLSYLVSGLMLGLFVLEQALGRPRASLPELGRMLLTVALAYLPTLPLLGWYFWNKGTETAQPAESFRHNLTDWIKLVPIRHMTASNPGYPPFKLTAGYWHYAVGAEASYRLLFAGLLSAALLFAAWQHLRRQSTSPAWAWLLGALFMVLAYVLLPDTISGGSVIQPRWGIFSYLLLLGSLTTIKYPPQIRAVLLAAATTVAVLFLGFRYTKYQTLQSGLADYLSVAAQLRPNASLLPLIYAQPAHMPDGGEYPSGYNMLAHAASYVSLERQLLDFENYEAETDYFPLFWRPGHLPIREPNATPARPTPLLLTHPAGYVLLWARNLPSPLGSVPNRILINDYLTQHYRLAYRSPSGLLELYSRR